MAASIALQWQPPAAGVLRLQGISSRSGTSGPLAAAYASFGSTPWGKPYSKSKGGEIFWGGAWPTLRGEMLGAAGAGSCRCCGVMVVRPRGRGQEEEARAGRLALRAVRLESFDPAAHA